VRTRADIEALRVADPERHLRYVLDAIALTRRTLAERVPLIGFAGSPWTLAAYMVDGQGTKDFKHSKRLMLDEPEVFRVLLAKLAESVRLFLEAQIAAGAQAVQIFDTLGGVLPPDHYMRFSLDTMNDIVARMHRSGVPVIIFSKGANHALDQIAQVGADVVSLDWTIDIGEARRLVGDRVALQGNLDPSFLYGSPESIRHEVRAVLKKYGPGTGHVFNLGHGMFPEIPPEHARALVRFVKEESAVYHS
jgi:uroporphyrinogen decarboxylase